MRYDRERYPGFHHHYQQGEHVITNHKPFPLMSLRVYSVPHINWPIARYACILSKICEVSRESKKTKEKFLLSRISPLVGQLPIGKNEHADPLACALTTLTFVIVVLIRGARRRTSIERFTDSAHMTNIAEYVFERRKALSNEVPLADSLWAPYPLVGNDAQVPAGVRASLAIRPRPTLSKDLTHSRKEEKRLAKRGTDQFFFLPPA
ncbi:hypothetical protein DFP73DRAFT_550699 [Morchella snyderi]|nr:hypothetical protein DFP73DRAFT_550699 [Morchella snyderi]